MRLLSLVIAIILASLSSQVLAKELTADEFSEFFEEKVKERAGITFKVGRLTVVSDLVGDSNQINTLSESEYRAHLHAKEEGALIISNLEKDRNIIDFYNVNVFGQVTISVSPEFKNKVKREGSGYVILEGNTFKLIEIVDINNFTSAVENYAMLKTIVSSIIEKFAEEQMAYFSCYKQIPNQKRKQILLLKYDDFAKKWNLVVGDIADLDKEFCTKNVSVYIAKLK